MNFNGLGIIGPTLETLAARQDEYDHLFVVDNGSTDGSPGWVEDHFPGVPVHRVARDGDISTARSWALDHAPTRHVFLCDDDVHVDEGCLRLLRETILAHPGTLAVTPRMVYVEDPSRIHHDVGRIHYLGVSGKSARGRSVEEVPAGDPRPTIPGGNALVDRRLARLLGGFDRRYDDGWGVDTDYYVRGIQQGMKCLHAGRALARHPVPEQGVGRAETRIHNRYRFLLSMYRGRTLALTAPPLLAFELAQLGLFAVQGLLGPWSQAVRRIVAGRSELLETRRRIQEARTEPDRVYLQGTGFSAGGPFGRSPLIQMAARVADLFFGTWWWLFGRFC